MRISVATIDGVSRGSLYRRSTRRAGASLFDAEPRAGVVEVAGGGIGWPHVGPGPANAVHSAVTVRVRIFARVALRAVAGV